MTGPSGVILLAAAAGVVARAGVELISAEHDAVAECVEEKGEAHVGGTSDCIHEADVDGPVASTPPEPSDLTIFIPAGFVVDCDEVRNDAVDDWSAECMPSPCPDGGAVGDASPTGFEAAVEAPQPMGQCARGNRTVSKLSKHIQTHTSDLHYTLAREVTLADRNTRSLPTRPSTARPR